MKLLVLLALLSAPRASAAPAAVPDAFVAAAARLGLARERGWTTLMFVRDRAFGPPTSMIATPEFFLAPKAGWTPGAELAATVAAMMAAPEPGVPPDEYVACRFPARRAWLTAHLPGFGAAAPNADCPALAKWQEELRTDAVSLVFSSYYSGNPSSMFGHSFLRLHKRPLPGKVASDILDETINFSAYPTTDNPFLYAVYGTAGRFPGRFSMLPFYIKIQEYNNAESRDLWEYRLTLTPADIRNLQLVLWDLGSQTINYWYFDENCSLILLTVLEAANPSLVLRPLHPWVIPSDSLRAIMRAPGLVKEVAYRPSALTRFLARYRALGDDERSVVDGILDANDPQQAETALRLLPPEQTAPVVDAVVEFIDFKEKLGGSKEAVTFGALRRALLVRRAGMRQAKADVPIPPPQAERPDRGGGTTRLGVAAGYGSRWGGLTQAEWRPALHDIAAPDLGYSGGLAITFFDTVLRYAADPGKVFLQRWDTLTILAVPHVEPIINPFAWNLEVGTENLGACAVISFGCFEEHVRGGLGPVARLGAATLYGIAGGELGASGERSMAAHAGPRAVLGVVWPLSPLSKLSADASDTRRFGLGAAVRNEVVAHGIAAFMLSEAVEVRLTLERRPESTNALASYYYYK